MKHAGFLVGLVIGGACGIGGTLLMAPRAEPDATVVSTAGETGHPSALPRAALAGRRVNAPAAGSVTSPGASSSAGAAQPPAATPETPLSPAQAARKARKEAWQVFRVALKALAPKDVGAAEIQKAVAAWRRVAKGDDVLQAQLAGRALTVLARLGKLTGDDVDALRRDFLGLSAGSPGRAGLAGAVARAWAREPQLAEWLKGISKTEEPGVRKQVIWSLDETPSAPYREWVLGLSETEGDASVLDAVWNEDIVVVNLTRESAPRFAETVDRRVGQGDLPPATRARGYMALGLSAQHASTASRRILASLLTTEAHLGVNAFGQAILLLIDQGESNLQALEGLWDEHESSWQPKQK